MIITIAGFKGGIGKTTCSMHLAGLLALSGEKTLLIDGDPNRSALTWYKNGEFDFMTVPEKQAPKYIAQYKHIIIDTQARPSQEEMKELAEGCDLLILPTNPERMSLQALFQTITTLQDFQCTNYKILLNIVPPLPSRVGEEARQALDEINAPLFQAQIRRAQEFQNASAGGRLAKGAPMTDYEALAEEIINEIK